MRKTDFFTSISVAKPSKQRCGDASFASLVKNSQGEAVLLAVADGVSQRPKDYLASSTVVKTLLENLSNSNEDFNQALINAILTANQALIKGVDSTLGMLSTLTVVLFIPTSHQLLYFNIGDSALFGLKEGKWHKLTTDDSVNVRHQSHVSARVLSGGSATKSLLSKAMGLYEDIEITINNMNTNLWDAVLLASDGFTGMPDFEEIALSISIASDMEKAAQNSIELFKTNITDDASFAIMRIPNPSSFDLKAIIESGTYESGMAMKVMNVLEQEIRKSIIEYNPDYTSLILDFMRKNFLFLAKDIMIDLLNLMVKYKSPLSFDISLIIRRL